MRPAVHIKRRQPSPAALGPPVRSVVPPPPPLAALPAPAQRPPHFPCSSPSLSLRLLSSTQTSPPAAVGQRSTAAGRPQATAGAVGPGCRDGRVCSGSHG